MKRNHSSMHQPVQRFGIVSLGVLTWSLLHPIKNLHAYIQNMYYIITQRDRVWCSFIHIWNFHAVALYGTILSYMFNEFSSIIWYIMYISASQFNMTRYVHMMSDVVTTVQPDRVVAAHDMWVVWVQMYTFGMKWITLKISMYSS